MTETITAFAIIALIIANIWQYCDKEDINILLEAEKKEKNYYKNLCCKEIDFTEYE